MSKIQRYLFVFALFLCPLVPGTADDTNAPPAVAPVPPAAVATTNVANPATPSVPVVTIVQDKPSGIYQPGEKITWTVTVTGDNAAPITTASYVLKKGGATVLSQGKLTFVGGTATIETTMNDPGTIRAEVRIPVTGQKPIQAVGGAAIAPEKIERSSPCPDDFDAFWKSKLDELAKVPENPVLVKADSGVPDIDYWKVTLDNIRGTHLQAQLARPVKEGKYPAMVIFQFAGVYPLDRNAVIGQAARGWLVLDVMAHDLPIDQPKAFYDNLAKTTLKWYPGIGDDDRENSYFVRMFLACFRAVDYMSNRPDWDGKTLIVTGTSQGGLQGFVAAALNPKVTAMMVLVPAGCDNTGDLVGRKPGWPYWMANGVGHDPAKLRDTSRYFDAVNFAARVKCPALVGLGLIDPTAPPSGVFAAINQMTGPKEVIVMPNSDHYGHNNAQAPYIGRAARWREALLKGLPPPLQPWPPSSN